MTSQLFLFWGSYLVLPAALAALRLTARGGALKRLFAAGLLAGCAVFAYARFIEPRLLTVEHAEIDLSGGSARTTEIKVALVADPHFGVFRHAVSMDRIAAKARAEGAHAMFIAGDLTYHADPEALDRHFAPLAGFGAPVFAVLGNHDTGFKAKDISLSVFGALRRIGAITVENRAVEAQIAGADIVVAGASDIWQRDPDFDFHVNLPDGVPVLLLAHNPDTALMTPESFDYDLMLAGHTHGGQIRIPWLYKRVIPTVGDFDKGLHVDRSSGEDRLVYVSPGTGMVVAPLRFLMPPRIDMLTLTVPATAPGSEEVRAQASAGAAARAELSRR